MSEPNFAENARFLVVPDLSHSAYLQEDLCHAMQRVLFCLERPEVYLTSYARDAAR